jgi:flagellar basal body-associated protein FliL
MNDKKETKAGSPATESAPAKNSRMFFIGVLAVVLGFQAVLGIVIVRMATARPAAAALPDARANHMQLDSAARAANDETAMGETTAQTPLDVVVNIAGTDGERFLKASVILEYSDREAKKAGGKEEKASPLGEAITQRMPKFKSFLIDELSKMTIDQLNAPDAREHIRKEFLKMANESLPSTLGEVRNVYFTEFIVQ